MACPLLRTHIARGSVAFGLNHEMSDHRTGRTKNLDLVVCRPRESPPGAASATFKSEADRIGVVLDGEARIALEELPPVPRRPVGAVLIAVEAKACMTAFQKARPRMYDELNSSHQTIHGNAPYVIAAGLCLVNLSNEFISPGLNDWDPFRNPPRVTRHRQPRDAAAVIAKLREVPRRSKVEEAGFDALAITVIKCRNDGTPVELVDGPPAPEAGDVHHYEFAVHRIAQLYEQRFRDG